MSITPSQFQELNQDLVSVFTPDEFSLLMNGVQNIDVEDWKDNTKVTYILPKNISFATDTLKSSVTL